MAGLGDLVQKALYLGVGIASYATEKAGVTLQELRGQAQKVADEMVARGEMTTEEARKYVDDLIQQAQQTPPTSANTSKTQEPRRIEIVSEDEEEPKPSKSEDVDNLRKQVELLQEELQRLKRP
jgi:polyhydroxyalkanoate synthesis regulator phasin